MTHAAVVKLHNAIIQCWARGMRGPAIASQFNVSIKYVNIIMERARNRGDERPVMRKAAKVRITVDPGLRRKLLRCAKDEGVSVERFIDTEAGPAIRAALGQLIAEIDG